MPESPLPKNDGLVTIKILLAGKSIDESKNIISVDINHSINNISKAEVSFFVDNNDLNAFSAFEEYKEIEIQAGWGINTETAFKGIVYETSVDILGGKTIFNLSCWDKVIALTTQGQNRIFVNKNDKDIIEEVLKEYKLESEIKAKTLAHEQVIQHQVSDWDFIQQQAQLNDLLIYTEDGKIVAKKASKTGAPDLVVTNGLDILSFSAKTNQQSTNLSPLVAPSAMPAKHKMLKIKQPSKVKFPNQQGFVSFFGSTKAKLNTFIELKGFGDKRDGNVLITDIHHSIKEGTWETFVDFGLTQTAIFTANTIASGIQNLHIGVITQLEGDPKGASRVQLTIADLGSSDVKIWAKLAHFYTVQNKGARFLPEIGTEVIVGFTNSEPVVLGMLPAKDHAYNPAVNDENQLKAIETRSGLKLSFDDEHKSINLTTPEGNELALSEADKSIVLKDQNGNEFRMDRNGIEIKSRKNLKLSAVGNIEIAAQQNIKLDATAATKVEGLTIDLKARTNLTAKGGVSAELSAGGQTTVKGAIVMIN